MLSVGENAWRWMGWRPYARERQAVAAGMTARTAGVAAAAGVAGFGRQWSGLGKGTGVCTLKQNYMVYQFWRTIIQ